MEEKKSFAYSRKILLRPAIGDWTTVQYRDSDFDEISISEVRNANFDSLTKDQMKQVHYYQYRLAEAITKKLSEDMDIKIELHSIVAMQLCYEDYLNSQNDQIVQSNFVIEGLGKANVIFDWSLADVIVDRLAGGRGDETRSEKFSEIEASILRAQMEQIQPIFTNVWKDVISVDQIRPEYIYGKYRKDDKVSLREAFIMFTYNLYFGKGDLKKIVWAYPSCVLRELLERCEKKKAKVKKNIELYPRTLKGIKLELKTTVGRTSLTMKELQGLREGDIIALDKSIETPLEMDIEGKAKFFVQPGTVANKICVQLMDFDVNDKEAVLKARTVVDDDIGLDTKKEVVEAVFAENKGQIEESVEGFEADVSVKNEDILGDVESLGADKQPIVNDDDSLIDELPIVDDEQSVLVQDSEETVGLVTEPTIDDVLTEDTLGLESLEEELPETEEEEPTQTPLAAVELEPEPVVSDILTEDTLGLESLEEELPKTEEEEPTQTPLAAVELEPEPVVSDILTEDTLGLESLEEELPETEEEEPTQTPLAAVELEPEPVVSDILTEDTLGLESLEEELPETEEEEPTQTPLAAVELEPEPVVSDILTEDTLGLESLEEELPETEEEEPTQTPLAAVELEPEVDDILGLDGSKKEGFVGNVSNKSEELDDLLGLDNMTNEDIAMGDLGLGLDLETEEIDLTGANSEKKDEVSAADDETKFDLPYLDI